MKNTTNKTSPAPSVVSPSTPAGPSGFTLGLDPGVRQPHVGVLDATGQIIREAAWLNLFSGRAGFDFRGPQLRVGTMTNDTGGITGRVC